MIIKSKSKKNRLLITEYTLKPGGRIKNVQVKAFAKSAYVI